MSGWITLVFTPLMTPATLYHSRHVVKHIQNVQRWPVTSVWNWQTGSILYSAWQKLNWDHKGSVLMATSSAALGCSTRGGDPGLLHLLPQIWVHSSAVTCFCKVAIVFVIKVREWPLSTSELPTDGRIGIPLVTVEINSIIQSRRWKHV